MSDRYICRFNSKMVFIEALLRLHSNCYVIHLKQNISKAYTIQGQLITRNITKVEYPWLMKTMREISRGELH